MQGIGLKSRLRGRVILPGEKGYDAERKGWNSVVEHRPKMIVVADGPEDVAAAVRLAVTSDLPVAVQATGHGPSVPADGAVLINTRRMIAVEVDPSARTARIGAGVRGERLMEASAPHGLAPLVGSTPDIGFVGYTASGGLPMLGRRYGFAADHVHTVDLVTADGSLRRATAEEHPDLFWAVRGGKGNFGVITSLETDLVPVTRLYGGGLFFPGSMAEEVLGGWLEWTVSQPKGMYSSLALRRFSNPPGAPEATRGGFQVHVRVAYTGNPAEGERLIRPLRALGPLGDTVADMPHARIGTVNNDPPGPAPVRDRGILLHGLDDGAIERLIALAGEGTELPPGQVEIRHLGGVLGHPPVSPNAISHRNAAFGMNLGMLVPAGHEKEVDEIQQTMIEDLGPWVSGVTLPNFLGSGATDPRRVRTAYSEADYGRLRIIKATHDPLNSFRVNHNIPPAKEQQRP